MAKRPTAYLGVDPGVSGALAFLDADGCLLEVLDIPTVTPGKSKKREVDISDLVDVLEEYRELYRVKAALERVSSRPEQGVSSTFTFGVAFGAIQAALTATNISWEMVSPTVWKKEFGLIRTEKDASRAVASRLFPEAELPKTKGVNRADALLMARWIYRKYLVGERRLFE